MDEQILELARRDPGFAAQLQADQRASLARAGLGQPGGAERLRKLNEDAARIRASRETTRGNMATEQPLPRFASLSASERAEANRFAVSDDEPPTRRGGAASPIGRKGPRGPLSPASKQKAAATRAKNRAKRTGAAAASAAAPVAAAAPAPKRKAKAAGAKKLRARAKGGKVKGAAPKTDRSAAAKKAARTRKRNTRAAAPAAPAAAMVRRAPSRPRRRASASENRGTAGARLALQQLRALPKGSPEYMTALGQIKQGAAASRTERALVGVKLAEKNLADEKRKVETARNQQLAVAHKDSLMGKAEKVYDRHRTVALGATFAAGAVGGFEADKARPQGVDLGPVNLPASTVGGCAALGLAMVVHKFAPKYKRSRDVLASAGAGAVAQHMFVAHTTGKPIIGGPKA